MALDARVHCDCFEKGRLKKPPPFPDRVEVGPDGFINLRDPHTTREEEAFDVWWHREPCPHPGFVLIHRRLGNIGGILWIREVLEQVSKDPASEFPVLRTRVVHSGSHGGDWLTLEHVRALRDELGRLRDVDLSTVRLTKGEVVYTPTGTIDTSRPEPATKEDLDFVRDVFRRLEELIEVSLRVGKPICF